MVIQLGFAQVRTAGVSQGDWFKYELTLDWEHDLEVTPEDFIFTDFLQGDYVILTIQNISGTNVTGQFTIHFENTTEKFLTGSVDLTTGEGDLRNWLISANLNANDPLYTTEIDEKINETVIQTYPMGPRETNHLVYSYNTSSGEDYSTLNVNLYWDKEIGILNEMSIQANLQQNGTLMGGSGSWILIESNIQQIPEFTQPILILKILMVTLLITILKNKEKITSKPLG